MSLEEATTSLWELFETLNPRLHRDLMQQVLATHRYAPEQWERFEKHMTAMNDSFLVLEGLEILEAMRSRVLYQFEGEALWRQFRIIVVEMTTYLDSLPTMSGRQSTHDDVLSSKVPVMTEATLAYAMGVARSEKRLSARLAMIYNSSLNIISVAQAATDAENERGESITT